MSPSFIPWTLASEHGFLILGLELNADLFWSPFLCSWGAGWSVLSLPRLPTRLPPDQRRGYKNVFNALIRIVREEGVPTLWRVSEGLESGGRGGVTSLQFLTHTAPHPPQGCIPTMARAVVVNAAQLASYSQSKQFLLDSGETQSWALAPWSGPAPS